MKKVLLANFRIIAALAWKDIRDAIQNKMITRVSIGTLMVWLSSMALPLLLSMRTTLDLKVFDPGRTELVRELAKDNQLDVRRQRSEDELRNAIGGSFGETLGLIVPPDIDADIKLGEHVSLQGYYPHWMEPKEVAATIEEVESKLEANTGLPLRIQATGGASYPSFQESGRQNMISSALVIVIFSVGGILTPYLMIEEKEKGTLAAIMVSPASQGQFVLGKALAGLFYSLIVATLALAMSGRWIVHWDLAILAVLGGALFTVSLGLLVGVLTENPSSMGLWVGLLMLVMLVPVFLEFSPSVGVMPWWQILFKWLPSVGFSDLIRASFVLIHPVDIYVRGFASMLGTGIILLVIVVWRLRKLEV